MSAYTEANFNACLEAINIIKAQRDKAVRIANCLTIPELDPRDVELLKKELSNLKAEIVIYQTRKK